MNDVATLDKRSIRYQILHLLKTQGSQTAATLAEHLQVSPMAIRQHLQSLQAEQWVNYAEARQAIGRPVKQWQLTEQASQLFPDSHADFVLKLIQGIRRVFGEVGLTRLLADRTRSQIQTYELDLSDDWNWRDRVAAIAHLRTQEGYMAEVIELSADAVLLVENHCSICAAARSCPQLCVAEWEVFTALLGTTVSIERVEHILQGDRRCAYRIARKPLETDLN
jgi:predicted ArsR family transcriptional regulator